MAVQAYIKPAGITGRIVGPYGPGLPPSRYPAPASEQASARAAQAAASTRCRAGAPVQRGPWRSGNANACELRISTSCLIIRSTFRGPE